MTTPLISDFSAQSLRSTLVASGAGVLLMLAYTLSPMTVWFGLATTAIFAWAGRGLEGRERLWVFGLLTSAVVVRLLVLIAFFVVTYRADGSFAALIPDEPYIARRSLLLRNVALGIPIAPRDYVEVIGRFAESGLLYVLAYVQIQLGPSPYGIRLLNIVLYLAAVIAVYRTVRPTFGAPAALGGMAVALFLPSLFVWSISALKEPVYLFITAISVSAGAAALRANTMPKRLVAMITCVIAILTVGTIREGAQIMVGGGILAGSLLAACIRRPVLLVMSLVGCLAVVAYALRDSRVQTRAADLVHRATISHIGHVKSGGYSYKLLDPELYSRRDLSTYRMTRPQLTRYAIRAAASVVLVPLPWALASRSALAYLPEQLIWYVLVILAVVGTRAGLRRDACLTLMFLGIIVLSGAAIAVTSGNVGTLVRHRSMVLMPLIWLSSLGGCTVLQWFATRRQLRAREPLHEPVHQPVGA